MDRIRINSASKDKNMYSINSLTGCSHQGFRNLESWPVSGLPKKCRNSRHYITLLQRQDYILGFRYNIYADFQNLMHKRNG